MDLKNQEQHGMKSLNYLMDIIPYQIFNIILSTTSKSMKNWLIKHQSSRISRLHLDTILSSWHLTLWNYSAVVKNNSEGKEWGVRMYHLGGNSEIDWNHGRDTSA